MLPGRVRFKSLDIYYNRELSKYIEKYVGTLYGVKFSKVTECTGSILVVYDIEKTNFSALKENIETALSASIIKNENDFKNFEEYFDAIKNRRKAKRKFLLWSALYLLLKIKGAAHGKFPISRNLNILKVASAVTIIGGYPLLKRIYKKFAKNMPTDADILLELTAISFTILRESSKGVFVLILKALNDYIKFSAEVESRKALLDSFGANFKMVRTKSLEGNEVLVPIDTLKIGDIIYAYTGEVVSVEGIIEEGEAVVNNLYCTGQPVISHIGKGIKIFEGTAVISGDIKIKVTSLPNTMEKKDISPESLYIHNRTKGFEDKMTPIAIGCAALSCLVTSNILNAFSIMLVLSPKPSSVAVHSGIKNYISLLNKNNIYLRNPNTFEKIIHVNKIIFDKTGTLTYGKMKIIDIEVFDSAYSKRDLLNICAACEVGNYHPISITLQDATDEIDMNRVDSSVLLPSRGIKANYNDHDVLIGNKKLMKEHDIDLSLGIEKYLHYQQECLTPIFVAINKKLIGLIVLNDIIRKGSKELIDILKYYRINNISILTGDSNPNAQKIASKLGIDTVYSNKDYLEKAQIVECESKNGIVMMIGDEINDVLAMNAADISISFTESSCNKVRLHSDYVIYEEDLLKLVHLISISQKTYSAMNRTILLSNLYNITLGVIAFVGGMNIFTAKSLNTLNSILVLLLNHRIQYIKPEKIDKRWYLKQEENDITKALDSI